MSPDLLENPIPLLVGIHLLASLIVFFFVPKNMTFFFLLFPGLGAIGLLGLEIIRHCQKGRTHQHAEPEESGWQPDELPGAEFPAPPSRSKRILEELDLMSLSEILLTEGLDYKRGAIEKLALLKTPEAIALLLHHRSDSSAEVRFHVTAALEKIKREFDEELEAAKNQMKKNPEDLSLNLSLSKIYLQYARSNLLDEATIRHFEREALFHLNQAISSGEADIQSYRMLIQLHKKRLEFDRATEVLTRLDQTMRVPEKEISKERIQICYESGRYPEMVHELRQLKEKGVEDPFWTAWIHWWTNC